MTIQEYKKLISCSKAERDLRCEIYFGEKLSDDELLTNYKVAWLQENIMNHDVMPISISQHLEIGLESHVTIEFSVDNAVLNMDCPFLVNWKSDLMHNGINSYMTSMISTITYDIWRYNYDENFIMVIAEKFKAYGISGIVEYVRNVLFGESEDDKSR